MEIDIGNYAPHPNIKVPHLHEYIRPTKFLAKPRSIGQIRLHGSTCVNPKADLIVPRWVPLKPSQPPSYFQHVILSLISSANMANTPQLVNSFDCTSKVDFSKPLDTSNLKNKSAVVTGGANGIGGGFVTALAENGLVLGCLIKAHWLMNWVVGHM